MSWFKKKENEQIPIRTEAIKGRWDMDRIIWEALTDSQLAEAWGNADSVWTERTQALAIVCAERIRKKFGPKRVILANTCIHSPFTFSIPYTDGVLPTSLPAKPKKKKSRK